MSGEGSIFITEKIIIKRSVFLEAIIEYAAKYYDGQLETKDIFQSVGTSTIECLLHAQQWLDELVMIGEAYEP